MDPRPRILGVDDSLTIRKALEIVLKPAGYELELAADGAEALAKAKALQPALILLDFILPDLRGTDVCRQLAADAETAHIPVVLISAKGAEIEQAYRDISNVVSYIAKPFKPPVLTSVVAEVLARAATGELAKLTVPSEAVHGVTALPPQVPLAGPELAPPVAGEALAAGGEVPAGETPAAPDSATSHPDDLDDAERDEGLELPVDDAAAAAAAIARRERIEWMFETLRSSLEGVYVEEVDTPTGAAADQAKSHMDLIEQLSRQLDEGLQHARTGARYRLYGDGSIRSFDEALLDVFRRSCRVLLRAAVADAGVHDTGARGDRVLVACSRHGLVYEQLQAVVAAHPEWSVVVVADNFRQLPLLVRLFGPASMIAEVTWSGALWDQLRTIQQMPEARTLRTIGVADAEQLVRLDEMDHQTRAALLAERGFLQILRSGFEVEGLLSGPVMSEGDQSTDELRMAV
jgi:CheY-like chemotaxis protein